MSTPAVDCRSFPVCHFRWLPTRFAAVTVGCRCHWGRLRYWRERLHRRMRNAAPLPLHNFQLPGGWRRLSGFLLWPCLSIEPSGPSDLALCSAVGTRAAPLPHDRLPLCLGQRSFPQSHSSCALELVRRGIPVRLRARHTRTEIHSQVCPRPQVPYGLGLALMSVARNFVCPVPPAVPVIRRMLLCSPLHPPSVALHLPLPFDHSSTAIALLSVAFQGASEGYSSLRSSATSRPRELDRTVVRHVFPSFHVAAVACLCSHRCLLPAVVYLAVPMLPTSSALCALP